MKKYAWIWEILIIVVLFSVLSGFNWGITETGTISGNPATDCRSIVKLNRGDWETYWHTFYCNGGECYAESMNGGQCDTVYFYSQSSNTANGGNQVASPNSNNTITINPAP